MNRRTALVVGATGLIGRALLDQLLKDDHYRTIITLTRRELGFTHERLVQLIVELDEMEEMRQLIEGTDVFCCLGTTMKQAGSKEAFRKVDYQHVMDVAKLALENGSENFFLVSSIGAKAHSKNFYLRTKGEIEEALKELSYKSLHIFRPASLFGDREERRGKEEASVKLLTSFQFALKGRLKKFRPISGEQVAKGMRVIAHQGQNGTHTYESDQIAEL
ncbi:MAG TPA: nucleoside-diphosphate sugar epimerase [Cytophagales bacterium]|nr:nucleoside-diphosphate sugar epimerase [Cytophagales bacterium]HAA19478.1 nucleoside-diphosphate sugar epimerase [Cytophagales bacterium]HAP59648.1 nucleoside-diphosphate sugar epimerase [Cytophagales bacterium]